MKEQAMNEMLAVVRKLRSENYPVDMINERMAMSLRAYSQGDYVRAIEYAICAF